MSSLQSNNAIANLCAWMKTMRHTDGYGGPVVHYWNNSLQYTGCRSDWSIEGLIAAFIALDKRMHDPQWLAEAKWVAQNCVDAQNYDGTYLMSTFEGTPAFWYSAQPHESAVNTGLLMLADRLASIDAAASEKYVEAAKKNIDRVLLPRFWNKKKQTFQQYAHGQFDSAPNLFVANKIATACESLVRLGSITGEKKYLEYAYEASHSILNMQETEGKAKGGIYQANNKENIITFYTGRCIRPLTMLGKATKEARYLKAARGATSFVASLQNSSGGFDFGTKPDGERIVFPRFVAGSGELLLGLHKGEYSREERKGMKWILSHQHPSGGIASFEGIRQKNTSDVVMRGESWMDALPVVGWGDKTLRYLAETGKGSIPEPDVHEWQKEYSDATLRETKIYISVMGEKNYWFNKKSRFSRSPFNLIKNTFFELARGSPAIQPAASIGFRAAVKW